jgi:hypothetical protein
MGARMSHGIPAKLVLALALIASGSSGAAAWGWWDKCDGGYTCYGPPYGNTEPPDLYVYDHRTGPTWTGNGWAYLPVGRYRPRPPEHAEPPPPPPPSYRDDDDDYDAMPPQHGSRRHRQMK